MSSNLNSLAQQIEKIARDKGASHFGIVDLKTASDFIVAQGGDWLTQFPFAVTAAVPMIDAWVDALSQQGSQMVMQSYAEMLEVIDRRWLSIAYEITLLLQNAGYRALPIAEHAMDRSIFKGIFSHKLAAHLAGFGWIGKNTLLVTPDRGPRVRLMSVLTTAHLTPTQSSVELGYNGCGDCRLCIDICPVQALTGLPFTTNITRDALLNAKKCSDYRGEQFKLTGSRHCGLCLHTCPLGQISQRSNNISSNGK
jgi:epoxyqueuosine reductase